MRSARHLLILGLASAASLGSIACGDDKDSGSAAPTTTQAPAPESQLASDPEVRSGLMALVRVAKGIGTVRGEDDSKKLSEGLGPIWTTFKGTLKRTDPESYATIEADLELLASGDQKKTKTGARELSKVVDGYLAKH
jgi:hypothetical protein